MSKILIYGNSGSGKTTLAAKFARLKNLQHLDLDTLAWNCPAIREKMEISMFKLEKFIAANEAWVIEGCYGQMIKELTSNCTELHFLNPGVRVCIKNNQSRPWEPHKYKSPEEQNDKFDLLQAWVNDYESRADEFSLEYHREIFENYGGKKFEHLSIVSPKEG